MGIGYGTKPIVKEGLICNIDASNVKSYSGSGTSLLDISGNGNHFTASGATFNSAEKFFNLADDAGAVIISQSNDIVGGLTNLSLEVWIRITTLPTTGAIFSYAVSSGDNNTFLIFKSAANQITPYKGAAQPNVGFNDSNWNTGEWIQFVTVRDAGNMYFYRNGEYIISGTMSTGALTSGGLFTIGQEQDDRGGGLDTSQDLPCDFSSFKAYNRALSASEIKQNYNSLKGRFGL